MTAGPVRLGRVRRLPRVGLLVALLGLALGVRIRLTAPGVLLLVALRLPVRRRLPERLGLAESLRLPVRLLLAVALRLPVRLLTAVRRLVAARLYQRMKSASAKVTSPSTRMA